MAIATLVSTYVSHEHSIKRRHGVQVLITTSTTISWSPSIATFTQHRRWIEKHAIIENMTSSQAVTL